MKKSIPVLLFLMIFASTTVFAVTLAKVKHTCPVCDTENEFIEFMSYGSYVYKDPSKYQYVFWPMTTSYVLYSCKDCKLTCFMWDFDDTPKDKFEEIKKALKDVKLAKEDDYTDIPMTSRIAVAEKVYKITKPDDDKFWCDFYRFKAYHWDSGDDKTARNARLKALEIVEKLIKDEKKKNQKKENLLIKAAMQYFTGEPDKALKTFNEAKKAKYKDLDSDDEENESINKNFDDYIDDYIKKIEKLACAKIIIAEVFAQKWFEEAIKAIKLEEKEKFVVLFPYDLRKGYVSCNQPIYLEINKKAAKVKFGASENKEKTLINFSKFDLSDDKAEITIIVGEAEPKDMQFKKEKDSWKLVEKESESEE